MADKRTTGIEIKKHNRSDIYRLLWKSEGLTKQEISDTLSLCLPTVSQNLEYFEKEKLVCISGFNSSTGGRRARTYSIVPHSKAAVGVDITKNHITAVIVDLKGCIIHKTHKTCPFKRSEEYFRYLGEIISDAISDSGISKNNILGVGIGIPALITQDHQKIFCGKVLDFEGATCEEFAKHIPYSTSLYNDANAAAAAELWSSPNMQDSLYIMLSRSVGGALIMNGQIYMGKKLRAGEVGHITVVPGGKPCYCGKLGCLDAYCCSSALFPDTAEPSVFFKSIDAGHGINYEILDNYLHHLAIAVHDVRMLLDCNIILGGYIGAYLDPHIEKLKHYIAKLDTFQSDCDYVAVCNYKNEAIAAGAALAYIRSFIETI